MRWGLALPEGDETAWAVRAENIGLGLALVTAPPGAECAVAGAVATKTLAIRLLVRIELGHENPVTVVEEINVVDNISNGRIAVLLDAGSLSPEEADEEIRLIEIAGCQRPFAHDGLRWTVPARLPEHAAPATMMVTPPPAQIRVPVWVTDRRHAAPSRPHLAIDPDDITDQDVAPGRLALTGDLDTDRDLAARWRDAGATHVIGELPTTPSGDVMADLSRWIAPEGAMVDFPRIVAEVDLPLPWPGRDQDTTHRRGAS